MIPAFRLFRVFPIALILTASLGVFEGGTSTALADLIPYPNKGKYNATLYSFTANASGNVIAYFAGSDATHNNQLGLLINGVLSPSGFGLPDHTSSIGQAFNLGHASAGDALVFVLNDLTLGQMAYTDASMNINYDSAGNTIGHNHVYATPYTATSPLFSGVPIGTYVAFEDQRFPSSDFSYADENFVFTNVVLSTPEPASFVLLALSTVLLLTRRRR